LELSGGMIQNSFDVYLYKNLERKYFTLLNNEVQLTMAGGKGLSNSKNDVTMNV
jgi:hypothetical protein